MGFLFLRKRRDRGGTRLRLVGAELVLYSGGGGGGGGKGENFALVPGMGKKAARLRCCSL